MDLGEGPRAAGQRIDHVGGGGHGREVAPQVEQTTVHDTEGIVPVRQGTVGLRVIGATNLVVRGQRVFATRDVAPEGQHCGGTGGQWLRDAVKKGRGRGRE